MQQLEHPYWQIYSQLVALRSCSNSERLLAVERLAEAANLNQWKRTKLKLLAYLPFNSSRLMEEIFFLALREKYAYSVLSPQILEQIKAFAPLVELGAGNGYNAWLLQQIGAQTVAMDAFPVEEGKNWFFSTSIVGLPTKSGSSFTRVIKGDSQALVDYPQSTLLMIWPPRNPMAMDALSVYKGKQIIVIGDKTCCATPAFYQKMKSDWKLESTTMTGSWDANHKEYMEIYTRL